MTELAEVQPGLCLEVMKCYIYEPHYRFMEVVGGVYIAQGCDIRDSDCCLWLGLGNENILIKVRKGSG